MQQSQIPCGQAWWFDMSGVTGSQCLVCSTWARLQCYKLPSLFQQWKQVITPYPFTSLMGFSALLCAAVMEHVLMKIHMASCFKISAILSSLFSLVMIPLHNCWKICQFSILHAIVVYFIDFIAHCKPQLNMSAFSFQPQQRKTAWTTFSVNTICNVWMNFNNNFLENGPHKLVICVRFRFPSPCTVP